MSSTTRTRSCANPATSHGGTRSPVRVLLAGGHDLAERLTSALGRDGWEVRAASGGFAALSLAGSFRPDLAVLDMALPDMDALELLHHLRADDGELPALLLRPSGNQDRVTGLTAGGEAVLTAPFSTEELVVRMRSLMQRSRSGADARTVITVGDLSLDEDSGEVRRGGDEIHLTATEFDLLRFLMRNARRVLSKPQILDRVWDYDFGGQANIVELYISYLRKKVDAGRTPMIHTVRGFGYVIRPAQ